MFALFRNFPRWQFAIATLLVFFVLQDVFADTEIAVRGLMKNSAVVEINGKQRMLKVGKASPEGVKLISATSKEAVIEVDGVQHTMGISKQRGIKFTEAPTSAEFRIPQGDNGHFFATGLINKRSSRMVVDTGASLVAISTVEADRLGLKYKNGERIAVSTASDTDSGYKVKLASVTVGSITVRNVDAVILPGEYPQIVLLGNSFLSKINMQVDAGVLILEAKY